MVLDALPRKLLKKIYSSGGLLRKPLKKENNKTIVVVSVSFFCGCCGVHDKFLDAEIVRLRKEKRVP